MPLTIYMVRSLARSRVDSRCSFGTSFPTSPSVTHVGHEEGTGCWAGRMTSFCPSVAPASLITTSVTSVLLPKLHLACADIATAEGILFPCAAYPVYHPCLPGHLLEEALLPESPKPSFLHPCLSSLHQLLFSGTIVSTYAQPSPLSSKVMGQTLGPIAEQDMRSWRAEW